MTWVVATLIIVFVLLLSVFSASLVSKSVKNINAQKIKALSLEQDYLFKESLLAFLLTKNDQEIIFEELNSDNELSDFAEQLAKDLSNEIKREDVVSMKFRINEVETSIFSYGDFIESSEVKESVKLNKNSTIDLVVYSSDREATI